MNENTIAELRRTHPEQTASLTDQQLLERWASWTSMEGDKGEFGTYLTNTPVESDPQEQEAAPSDEPTDGAEDEPGEDEPEDEPDSEPEEDS